MLTQRNKFEALQEITGTPTHNDEYENFVNDHLEETAECTPIKQKAKLTLLWETFGIRKKRTDMKNAFEYNWRSSNYINAPKLKKAQNELVNIYLKEQTECIQITSLRLDIRLKIDNLG